MSVVGEMNSGNKLTALDTVTELISRIKDGNLRVTLGAIAPPVFFLKAQQSVLSHSPVSADNVTTSGQQYNVQGSTR